MHVDLDVNPFSSPVFPQAVEVSSLIPLKYACRRLILVGDPKQLPATVFSDAATGADEYEQALVCLSNK